MENDGEGQRETYFMRARRESQIKEREIGRKSKGIQIHPVALEN